MTFKQLEIGDIFEFDRIGLTLGHGLASGPWKKVGARRYIRLDDNLECRVGAIHTTVIKV